MHTFHIILTRFNVRRGRTADPRALSTDWLRTRIQLFRDATVASILLQTRAPDLWLVFFDEATPSFVRVEMEALGKEIGALKAEYCGELTTAVLEQCIRKNLPVGVDWLVTTRLDNDDALNPRFIEFLMANVMPGIREFINPKRGLIVSNGLLYRKRDYSSPFISFSEPVDEFRTVWLDQHHRLCRYATIKQLDLQDAWIQLVHGGNIANQVRGIRVLPRSIVDGLLPPAIQNTLKDVNLGEFIIANSFGLILRYVRSAWRRGRVILAEMRSSQVGSA